jgi:hypothetical protein
MIKKIYIGLHVIYPLFLSDFNENILFLKDLKKNEISNFIKVCPEEAELFHVDSQIDRKPDNQLFANVPKNGLCQDFRFSKQ